MMDRETLIELMKEGPVRVTMNSGDTVEVTSTEMAFVSSMSLAALVPCKDGKFRMKLFPLVTMSKAEHFSPAS